MNFDPISEGYSDLDQILSYRGATSTGDSCEVVADELIATPCFTERFCESLIRAANACGEFGSDPNDPVPGREVSLRQISQRLFELIQDDLGSRIWPRLQSHWPGIDYYGLSDAFVIKYEKGVQEELRLHHDVAQVSGSIKLNNSYSGGELEFPRQGYSNAGLPVGTLLAWPSLVTHPHRSSRLVSGTKYSLTLWFELPLQLI